MEFIAFFLTTSALRSLTINPCVARVLTNIQVTFTRHPDTEQEFVYQTIAYSTRELNPQHVLPSGFVVVIALRCYPCHTDELIKIEDAEVVVVYYNPYLKGKFERQ